MPLTVPDTTGDHSLVQLVQHHPYACFFVAVGFAFVIYKFLGGKTPKFMQ